MLKINKKTTPARHAQLSTRARIAPTAESNGAAKVKVIPELCIGCGKCEAICPDVFKIQDDCAIVLIPMAPQGQENACRQAAAECPVDAIVIEE